MRRLIEEAKELAAGKTDPWVQRAHLAVAAAYGDDSPNLKRFDDIAYGPLFFTDSTPDNVFTQAEMSGVREAASMLEAFVEDLADEEDQPGPDPTPHQGNG